MVERYLRIWRPGANAGKPWHLLVERVRVFEVMDAQHVPDDATDSRTAMRTIFQIRHVEGLTRGCRIGYLGQDFLVKSVSDSSKLRGLELICEAQQLVGG